MSQVKLLSVKSPKQHRLASVESCNINHHVLRHSPDAASPGLHHRHTDTASNACTSKSPLFVLHPEELYMLQCTTFDTHRIYLINVSLTVVRAKVQFQSYISLCF